MKYLILFLFWSCFASGQNEIGNLPVLTGFVNDYEEILLPHQEMILEESVKSFYEENGIAITIVTVNSISPYNSIFKYSLDLSIAANRGKVLIVASKNLNQIHIQTVESVSDKLTNDEINAIIENFILPKFKERDYFKGLLNGILEVKKELN